MITTSTQPRTVLEVIDLAKHYGERQAVRGVSLTIHAGEIFGLLGPNGAGKTTTIGMMASIIATTSGSIRVQGQDIGGRSKDVKKSIGFVPQELCLYPSLNAEENLNFFGRMYGLDGSELASRVAFLLELTGLDSRRRDRVSTFSGGMKRRLNLACGLVHQPKLLLLDEPTVGVDPQSRERIFATVEELAAGGMAIVYTTHYMEEAERLCQRLAIMDEGRIVAEGTVSELVKLIDGGSSVSVTFKEPPSTDFLASLKERGAQQSDGGRFLMPGDPVEEKIPDLLQLVSADGNTIQELLVHRPNLGEVFLHLTGKELRD